VGEGFERCGRVCNGAGESGNMPGVLECCFRVWSGGEEPGAVFNADNAVIDAVMLPESLRHRFKA